MTVIDPVKVVLTNYPEDKMEYVTIENNPEQETMGTRQVPFGRTIYIEREDFMETPVKKFFRMTLGKEVRLKGHTLCTVMNLLRMKRVSLKRNSLHG